MTYTNKIVNGVEIPLTQDEINALEANEMAWDADALNRLLGQVRDRRNQLLSQCDWLILPDIPTTFASNLVAWKTYRQALRDITKNLTGITDISQVVWPLQPQPIQP